MEVGIAGNIYTRINVHGDRAFDCLMFCRLGASGIHAVWPGLLQQRYSRHNN